MIRYGNTLDPQADSPERQEMQSHFAACIIELFVSQSNAPTKDERLALAIATSEPSSTGNLAVFQELSSGVIAGNRFFITKERRMGIASRGLEIGDTIMLFSGGGPIYIVREQESDYRFIGDGYIRSDAW